MEYTFTISSSNGEYSVAKWMDFRSKCEIYYTITSRKYLKKLTIEHAGRSKSKNINSKKLKKRQNDTYQTKQATKAAS